MKFFLSVFLCLLNYFVSAQTERIDQLLNSSFYQNQFTGFYLYDPDRKEVLYDLNGGKRFLPASNTKIFTEYAILKNLQDSIPGILYLETENALHIQGTGDPTFLHPKFDNQRVLNFLKRSSKKIILHYPEFLESPIAYGWSWDDYASDYASERSLFPIAENRVSIVKKGNKLDVFPKFFENQVKVEKREFARDRNENKFYIDPSKKDAKIPFIVNAQITQKILEEVTQKTIELDLNPIDSNATILFSQLSEPVSRNMMEESDNFLAEHLLMASSYKLNKNVEQKNIIDFLLKNDLKEIAKDVVWNDGSGLSRYNLFTPKSIVYVLEKMYKEYPKEKIFNQMAIGGKTGSLKNRYYGNSPYIYAKTGAFSNNVTLSGYLITKSGRILIFSLMNNHTTEKGTPVRNENEKLIKLVRDLY